MNVTRRAFRETKRAVGISVPTAVAVILGIALAITASQFPIPVDGPFGGIALWLIQSMVWLITMLIVFIPLMVWNVFKVVRQERIASANLSMAAKSAASKDERIKSFLRNTLGESYYGVAICYLYGSIVHQYPTRDVDIIIQFESSEPCQVRIYRDRLRDIEASFKEFHGLGIHLQTFLSTEDAKLQSFLIRAGSHERIK